MKKYSIIFLLFTLFSCTNNAKRTEFEEVIKPNHNNIVPFEVQSIQRFLDLNDSGFTGSEGKVVLEIFLDKQGNKEGFLIKFFHVVDKEGNEVERFFKYSDKPISRTVYPVFLQNNFESFKKFTDTIAIIKNKEVFTSEKSRISIPITLNMN